MPHEAKGIERVLARDPACHNSPRSNGHSFPRKGNGGCFGSRSIVAWPGTKTRTTPSGSLKTTFWMLASRERRATNVALAHVDVALVRDRDPRRGAELPGTGSLE